MKASRALAMLMTITLIATMLFAVTSTAYAAGKTYEVTTADQLRQALTGDPENDIAPASAGDTVKLMNDITHEGKWNSCYVPDGVTIDGNNKMFRIGYVEESGSAGVFYGKFAAKDLTIVSTTAISNRATYALHLKEGGSATNVTVDGGFMMGMYYEGDDVQIKDCKFVNEDMQDGLYTESSNTATIEGCVFDTQNAARLASGETFINNTVNSEDGVKVRNTAVKVSGNTFTGAQALNIKVNGTVAIANNTISNGGKVEIENGTADLSGNNWGPNGPQESQLVQAGGSKIILTYSIGVVQPAATAPKTGDETPIALLAMLMMLSALAGLSLRKRSA